MIRPLLHIALTIILWIPVSSSFGSDFQISPEFTIASDVTQANSDTQTPGKPGIGFDGTNYLVVSCREEELSANIIGVLISTDGEIESSFQIADLNPVYGCSQQRPSVAFDGTNYLAVFSQVTATGSRSVVGARITPAGTVLDGPSGFTILTAISDSAAVAFDGSSFLVVSARFSSDTLHDIVGAKLSTDGHVLDEFPIFTAPGGQVFSSVAFDGTNYFVIWSDTRSGSPVGPDADIYGTRVSPEGFVLDPEGIPVSTALGSQSSPHIIFDGNNYIAVWHDTRNDPDIFPPVLDIYGTRITPDGFPLDGSPDTGGIAIATHPYPQTHPVVSFDGTNYVVTWEMSFFYNEPVGIFAARVSTNGILIDGPPDDGGILISEPSCFACRLVWPNSLFSGRNILLTWVNNTEVAGTAKDIVGVLVTSSAVQLEIQIDVKTLNPNSRGKINVALLTTGDFDASTVDVSTVKFGPSEAQPVGYRLRDVDSDGDWDYVLRFAIDETGIVCGDSEATVTGETINGEQFTGTDTIKTVGCK